jgi:phospholipid transport system substrate-binding protein
MRRVLPAIAACACIAGAGWALSPLQCTRETLDHAGAIMASDGTRNEKLAALSGLLNNFLDTDSIGRAALDKNWSRFTPAQQQTFLALFRELFRRTYVEKLLLFERPRFTYVGESVAGDTARVETKIVTARDEFTVTYQLQRRGDRWVATDIAIEELSLTANFHRQLERLLARSSVDDILDRMRRKYEAATDLQHGQ